MNNRTPQYQKITSNTSFMASTLMQKIMLNHFDEKIENLRQNNSIMKSQKQRVSNQFSPQYLQTNKYKKHQTKLKLNIQYEVYPYQNLSQIKYSNSIKQAKLKSLKQLISKPSIYNEKEKLLVSNKKILDFQNVNKSQNKQYIMIQVTQSQELDEKEQKQQINQKKFGRNKQLARQNKMKQTKRRLKQIQTTRPNQLKEVTTIQMQKNSQNHNQIQNSLQQQSTRKQASPKKVAMKFELFYPKSKLKTTINHAQIKNHTRRSVNITSIDNDFIKSKKYSQLNGQSQHQKISFQANNQNILQTMGKNSAQKYFQKIQKYKKFKQIKQKKQIKFGLNVLPAQYHEMNLQKNKLFSKPFFKKQNQKSQSLNQVLFSQNVYTLDISQEKFQNMNATFSQGMSLSLHQVPYQENNLSKNNIFSKQCKSIQNSQKKCPSQNKLLRKNMFGLIQQQRKKSLFKSKFNQSFMHQKGYFKNKFLNMLNSLDQVLNAFCCKINSKKTKNNVGMDEKVQLINKRREILSQNEIKQKLINQQKSSNKIKQGLSIQLTKQTITLPTSKNKEKFLFYIGNGNNKNLIRAIMKKRGWWMETDSMQTANFIWTQLKIKQILQKEEKMSDKKMQQPDSWHFKQNTQINQFQLPKYGKNKSQNFSQQFQEYKKVLYLKIFHSKVLNTFHNKLSQRCKQIKHLRQLQVPNVIHNHFDANYMLGNKKALFFNLVQYGSYKKNNVYQFIPLTFHIQKIDSRQFRSFQKAYKKHKNSLWIVKPGENSNRGNGIFVENNYEKIKAHIQTNCDKHSFIIQKYLKQIFLYNKRKFDIRVYMLMTTIGGITKFFWYQEGYIRTSSQPYNPADVSDLFIHLTNDAIQVNNSTYSKYEKGNKLSFSQFQRYLDSNYSKEKFNMVQLNAEMKKIAEIVVRSTYFKLDKTKKVNGFELFGLDFLIDKHFKPWLLQVNTNPCLQLSSPVLQRLIPRMLENMFRISLDPLYRPNQNISRNQSYFLYESVFESNKFSLIFDSLFDSDFEWQEICGKQRNMIYEEDDEIFENNGEELTINQ